MNAKYPKILNEIDKKLNATIKNPGSFLLFEVCVNITPIIIAIISRSYFYIKNSYNIK